MDDRILEVLNAGLVLSPTIIAYNIDKSREAVGRRLSELSKSGLVKRIERDRYEITERGSAYRTGELNVDELEDE
ncbi:transcriptional regulator [Halorubrum pallidum]|uniref:Transcriptional regulator n=1 Tax=Halorubrum pallidum TaxID=1526114 RepID=A0ABD5T605_9EURY